MTYAWSDLTHAMEATDSAASIALGISGATLRRYQQQGLSFDQADRLAVRAGLVPYHVWPQMVDDVIAAASVSCTECEEPFVPARRNQKFCTKHCKHRFHSRRYERERYARDPEWRRRKIERSARYYAEAAELRRRRASREGREPETPGPWSDGCDSRSAPTGVVSPAEDRAA